MGSGKTAKEREKQAVLALRQCLSYLLKHTAFLCGAAHLLRAGRTSRFVSGHTSPVALALLSHRPLIARAPPLATLSQPPTALSLPPAVFSPRCCPVAITVLEPAALEATLRQVRRPSLHLKRWRSPVHSPLQLISLVRRPSLRHLKR